MTRAYEAVQQHGGLQNAELQDISNEMRTEFSKWQEEKKALHEEKAQLEQQVAKLQSALVRTLCMRAFLVSCVSSATPLYSV